MYVTGTLLPPDPAVLSHFLFLGQLRCRSRRVLLKQGTGGDRNSQGHAGSQERKSLAETLGEVPQITQSADKHVGGCRGRKLNQERHLDLGHYFCATQLLADEQFRLRHP